MSGGEASRKGELEEWSFLGRGMQEGAQGEGTA